MLDTLRIYNELKEKLEPEAALKIAEMMGYVYGELQNTVTRTEFNELKKIVRDLGEAQKRTEQRVEELAEAQKRTEQRVEELAEAQKRTEQRVEELAVAQKKTEEAIKELIYRVDNLTDEVGGISHTIGYQLEDHSYPRLKIILKERFNLEVEKLYRKNIVYSIDHFDEINIYGEARRKGKKLFVIGECKSQFGPKDVDRYLKLIDRVKHHLQAEVFPLALSYNFHPRAEEKLINKKIPYLWSFELNDVTVD